MITKDIKKSKILLLGSSGMVGSAIGRKLFIEGFTEVLKPSSKTLNALDQARVLNYFDVHKPEYVYICCARVGGIHANNTYRANFIYENLMMASNIIHTSYLTKVKKVLFLGSSCVYPKSCPQPIKEEYLLTSPLEYTNEPYAVAKIAGLKMIENYNLQYGTDFISCMPTNLYGIHDTYDRENSHVIPAMIQKFYEAKNNKKDSVVLWGDGSPKREFLYVDDLAEACIFLMHNYSSNSTINIGSGVEVTIKQLAETIKEVVGYKGKIEFDTSKPNGTPRKLLDCTKINKLGWHHKINLREGLEKTYLGYLGV